MAKDNWIDHILGSQNATPPTPYTEKLLNQYYITPEAVLREMHWPLETHQDVAFLAKLEEITQGLVESCINLAGLPEKIIPSEELTSRFDTQYHGLIALYEKTYAPDHDPVVLAAGMISAIGAAIDKVEQQQHNLMRN